MSLEAPCFGAITNCCCCIVEDEKSHPSEILLANAYSFPVGYTYSELDRLDHVKVPTSVVPYYTYVSGGSKLVGSGRSIRNTDDIMAEVLVREYSVGRNVVRKKPNL